MDCNETRHLLQLSVDGELDLVRQLELDAHLRSCTECALIAEGVRARRTALHERLPRFAAPTRLAEKIRAATATPLVNSPRSAADRLAAGTRHDDASRAKMLYPIWRVVGLAASIALAVFAGYGWGNARARSNLLIDEALASHVRSLQVNHLTDVTSTDQHTVKPWFAGKLDFSPPVIDLATSGFPLIGGRLEQFDGRPAAALVFHRRLHAINVFVWPSQQSAVPTRTATREGYNVESWNEGSLNFVAVSEIPASELAQFTAAFRAASK